MEDMPNCKTRNTHIPLVPPPLPPSPGTYLQLQVVGRHGNCRRVRAICIVSAFISKTMSLSIQYRSSCLFVCLIVGLFVCPPPCLSASVKVCPPSWLLSSFPVQSICALLLHHPIIYRICLLISCTAGVLHVSAPTLFCTHSLVTTKLPSHTQRRTSADTLRTSSFALVIYTPDSIHQKKAVLELSLYHMTKHPYYM